MSGVWCWVGRQRLAWGTDVPWASHRKGLSANCWCFLFKPKSSCSQKPLGSKTCCYSVPVLHFTSDIYFKRLSGFFMLPLLDLTHSSPHSAQEGRRAGADVASAS